MSALEKILAKGDEVAIKAARHTASYICRWNKQDEAERRAAANDNRTVKYPGIVCSAEFVNGFVPPDYHIDGIAQSGFFYSLTAMTGTGKTAVLLLITALTALGKPLGDLEVRKGRVLYFAGENPDDIAMRWIAMSHHMGFDANNIDVHFLQGTFSIPEMLDAIRQDVSRLGGVSMIVIDTSAAYFQGADDNARDMRELTTLEGHPIVCVAVHPTKNPDPTNLLPRGGGALLNEVDGNLVLLKGPEGVKLTSHGKHRGVDFKPMMFELKSVSAPALKDSRGRDVPTVMACALSQGEARERAHTARKDEDEVLLLIECNGKMSLSAMAEELGWRDGKGEPNKTRAQRASEKLTKENLVKPSGWGRTLTQAGRDVLADIKAQRFREENAAGSAAALVAKVRK